MSAVPGEYLEWKQWSAEQFGQLNRRERRYYAWHVNRALGKSRCTSVLEIGFGNGAFLAYCKSRGWHATGIELEPQLRERAKQAGFAAVSDIHELASGQQFDLIVLFDVLEHIPADSLLTFASSIATHLTPDGAILLRVPSGDSPFGRVYQHGDLTHVTAFSQFKIDQLAKMCGLRMVKKGEAPWNAQQHEARTARALLRGITRKVLSRLFSFAYYGWKVDLSGNFVAVLRHK